MDIFVNDKEVDVTINTTIYDYWEFTLWDKLILPIEDGRYNNFDLLEDQDPSHYEVKGDTVSYFTDLAEIVYDYNTGVALKWTYKLNYDFTLEYNKPRSSSSSAEDTGFLDQLPFPLLGSLIGFGAMVVMVAKRRNEIFRI